MMLTRQTPVCVATKTGKATSLVAVRRPLRQQRVQPARAVETPPGPLDSIALKTIEDLDPPCDDFVCTSSPAVEQTVRSLARELTRGRYATVSMFQPTVTYSDGFRTFTGTDGYGRTRWISDNVEPKFKTAVTRMRMLDKGTSVIEWSLDGKLGGQQLSIAFTTTCEHNLLTGRVTSQRESWNLSRCSPPAAALATFNRYAWSAKQALQDAKDGLSKLTEKLGGGGGADDANLPSDPTRFYQQGANDGGAQQDLFAIGFLVALIYLAFKLFGELETMG